MTYEELKEKIIKKLNGPYDSGEYRNLQEIEDLIDRFFIQEDELDEEEVKGMVTPYAEMV